MNYIEKILETEMYVLEGSLFENFDRLDADTIRKKKRKIMSVIKDQKNIMRMV
jgi:hypothetical protein